MAYESFVVIKLGGAVADDTDALARLFCEVRKVMDGGVKPIIVHGGGIRLTQLAARLGVKSEFIGGRRVTDDSLLELAKMSFFGSTGLSLASVATAQGLKPVPLTGASGLLIEAQKRPRANGIDYGWVGEIIGINPKILLDLLSNGYLPLVASLGVGRDGQFYNINADTIAAKIADALAADCLLLFTEFDGIRYSVDDPHTRISKLNLQDVKRLKDSGVLSGGMLPKVEAIGQSLAKESGVKAVRVTSWRHAQWLGELLSHEADYGTVFIR